MTRPVPRQRPRRPTPRLASQGLRELQRRIEIHGPHVASILMTGQDCALRFRSEFKYWGGLDEIASAGY